MKTALRIKVFLGALLGLGLLAAGGCGPKATVDGYREMLDHYRGGHIDQLVAAWGAPRGEHTYKDGRREYLFFRENRTQYYDGPHYSGLGIGLGYHHRHFGIGGVFYPNSVSTRYTSCETRVITDRRGNIQEYYFRGDACRALPYKSQPQGQSKGYQDGE